MKEIEQERWLRDDNHCYNAGRVWAQAALWRFRDLLSRDVFNIRW